ncbi:MAG: hypothetical protein ACI9Y7_002621, partial [Dokdonia sp.]
MTGIYEFLKLQFIFFFEASRIKLSSYFVNFKDYMNNPTCVLIKKRCLQLAVLFLLFSSLHSVFAQENTSSMTIIPEFVFGTSAASNKTFPERKLQKQAIFNFVWHHENNTQEWAQWLHSPRTGISLGYTDFGNSDRLGSTFTLMPFLEFNAFKSTRLTTQIGIGTSYFTEEYDFETNFFNRAVSTDFTWSFRAFMHYNFLQKEKVNYRVGAGIFHHSNGHT